MFWLYVILNLALFSHLHLAIHGFCTDCYCVHGKTIDTPIIIPVGKRIEISVHGPVCFFSIVTYTWKAVSSKGELLYDLGTTLVPRVFWQPYKVAVRPSIKEDDNLIVVTKSDGLTTGRCECHIAFFLEDMYTHIDGSEIMHIGTKQLLWLSDKTRDVSQPYLFQRLRYRWHCVPIKKDKNSPYCNEGNVLSTGATAMIDGHQLMLGAHYKVIVDVRSPVTGQTARTQTYLIVTHGTQIPLFLGCYHNCRKSLYNVGEAMHIWVDCFGQCGRYLLFTFYIDGIFQTFNRNGHYKFMPPDQEKFQLKFTLTAGFRFSEGVVTFYRNDPPSGGKCTIDPTSGIAGETKFKASCSDWTDKQIPLKYELKAEHLVYDRTTDPHWEVYAPEVDELTFVICDTHHACSKQNVPITLTKPEIPKGLDKIKKHMKKEGNDIKNCLKGGEFARAVVKAILMMKDQDLKTDKYIVSQFHDFEPNFLTDVLQLGTMTNQLMSSVGNLTSSGVKIFLDLLDKMCEGFKKTIESDEIKDIELDDLHELAEEVIDLVTKFTTNREHFTDVQSLLWEYEGGMVKVADERAKLMPRDGQLIEYYAQYDKLNDTVLLPINQWMYALVKTFELLHNIGIASSFRIHKGDEKFIIDKHLVQMETFGIDDDENVTIVSPDGYTSALLTTHMLKDMQDKLGGEDMTAQVVSFRDNPFWWYPTEHPITTSVFYFSSFSEEDQNIGDTELDVPIKLDMLQHERDKEPPIIQGAVNASNEMPIYRIRTPAGAAVIINFTNFDIDMDVLVKCKSMPNVKEVRAARKLVEAAISPTGIQYTASNHERTTDWCYVALIASEKVKVHKMSKYNFTVEMYECLTWNVNLENPTWRTEGCVAMHEDENITCLCYHMSIFAGRSYYTTADEVVRERTLKDEIDINWYLVAFYIFLILLFIWLLLRAYDDLDGSDNKLLSEMYENEQKRVFNIALYITTGGQWSAKSSANVLVSVAGGRTYTIVQNPEKPLLKPNATCVLELPIKANDLPDPPKITLSQDGSGRYPSWYCESITIVNLENGEKRVCTVRKWIGKKPVEVEPDKDGGGVKRRAASGKKDSKAEKWKKFKSAYHDMFMCWFLFQPLVGPRQYGVSEVDRFVRSCIWIAKFAVMIMLVFIYFGETTLDNYEAERTEYEYLIDLIDGKFILFLFGCYFVTLLVELLMLLIVYPDFLCKFIKGIRDKIKTR